MTNVVYSLGFIVPPVLYAIGTFGFFHYLNNRASTQAKSAISNWLAPKQHNEVAATSKALTEVFDRLYAQPLLSSQAFLRSSLFSTAVFLVHMYEHDNATALK